MNCFAAEPSAANTYSHAPPPVVPAAIPTQIAAAAPSARPDSLVVEDSLTQVDSSHTPTSTPPIASNYRSSSDIASAQSIVALSHLQGPIKQIPTPAGTGHEQTEVLASAPGMRWETTSHHRSDKSVVAVGPSSIGGGMESGRACLVAEGVRRVSQGTLPRAVVQGMRGATDNSPKVKRRESAAIAYHPWRWEVRPESQVVSPPTGVKDVRVASWLAQSLATKSDLPRDGLEGKSSSIYATVGAAQASHSPHVGVAEASYKPFITSASSPIETPHALDPNSLPGVFIAHDDGSHGKDEVLVEVNHFDFAPDPSIAPTFDQLHPHLTTHTVLIASGGTAQPLIPTLTGSWTADAPRTCTTTNPCSRS